LLHKIGTSKKVGRILTKEEKKKSYFQILVCSSTFETIGIWPNEGMMVILLSFNMAMERKGVMLKPLLYPQPQGYNGKNNTSFKNTWCAFNLYQCRQR
jgi:hypothetical protein